MILKTPTDTEISDAGTKGMLHVAEERCLGEYRDTWLH